MEHHENNPIAIPHSLALAEASRKRRPAPKSAPIPVSKTHRKPAPAVLPTKPPAKTELPKLSEAINSIQRLDKEVQRLASLRDSDIKNLQQVAVQLAIEIASTIVDRELSAEGYDPTRQVVAALNEIEYELATVRLNPLDASRFDAELDLEYIKVREDGSVEPGNCVIDTNEVTLERTWRDQLERIRTNLLSELSDART
jgi:flagellar biosynthesis/type III secretory pathway protein FliH